MHDERMDEILEGISYCPDVALRIDGHVVNRHACSELLDLNEVMIGLWLHDADLIVECARYVDQSIDTID
jgi:hypothetical protein